MTRIVFGNRELSVEDNVVDSYIAKGWHILDARGRIIDHPTNATYGSLIVENAELKQTVKRLEASNASLAASAAQREEEIAGLKDELAKAKASLSELASAPPATEEPSGGKESASKSAKRK